MNAIGDEVETGAAVHRDRCPGMVGEHEDGSVVRRAVAPPTLPGVGGPGALDRPKLFAAHDPSAVVREPPACTLISECLLAPPTSQNLPQRSGATGPFLHTAPS